MPKLTSLPNARPLSAAVAAEVERRRRAARQSYLSLLGASDNFDANGVLDAATASGFGVEGIDDDAATAKMLPGLRAAAAELPVIAAGREAANRSIIAANRHLAQYEQFIAPNAAACVRGRVALLSRAWQSRAEAAHAADAACKLASRRFDSGGDNPPSAERVSAACSGAATLISAASKRPAGDYEAIKVSELPRVPKGTEPALVDSRLRASLQIA